MNIAINLSPLKSGGGQNVGMNFVIGLKQLSVFDHELLLIVAKGSELHKYLLTENQNHLKYIVVPSNPVLRVINECLFVSHILKLRRVDIVYSYFGYGFYGRSIKQVVGSAYSNIFYPEIDFWEEYNGLKRLVKRLIDLYRLWGVKRASAVVVENPMIETRAREVIGIKNVLYVKPSIALPDYNKKYLLPSEVNSAKKRILFLCGWQKNKNYLIIPQLASELKSRGENIHFVFTAPIDNSRQCIEFFDELSRLDVRHMVSVIGSVEKKYLASLYSQIDYVALLSKLESFSNNIIEAWYFQRPLIVSDEEWARGICGDAALYVRRDSVIDVADKIIRLGDGRISEKILIGHGEVKLSSYPNVSDRIRREIKYLEHVFSKI